MTRLLNRLLYAFCACLSRCHEITSHHQEDVFFVVLQCTFDLLAKDRQVEFSPVDYLHLGLLQAKQCHQLSERAAVRRLVFYHLCLSMIDVDVTRRKVGEVHSLYGADQPVVVNVRGGTVLLPLLTTFIVCLCFQNRLAMIFQPFYQSTVIVASLTGIGKEPFVPVSHRMYDSPIFVHEFIICTRL